MPSIRTIRRSAYSAASTVSVVADGVRARADRYTVTGSVACSATIASVAPATEAAEAAEAPDRRCLAMSLARRWAVVTLGVIAGRFP